MNRDSEGYRRLIEEHLSALAMHGLSYLQQTIMAIELLSEELDGISHGSEENAEIIMILKKSVKDHIELIEWSINDRKQKFDQG